MCNTSFFLKKIYIYFYSLRVLSFIKHILIIFNPLPPTFPGSTPFPTHPSLWLKKSLKDQFVLAKCWICILRWRQREETERGIYLMQKDVQKSRQDICSLCRSRFVPSFIHSLIFTSVCLHVCICTTCVSVCEGQKRMLDRLNLELHTDSGDLPCQCWEPSLYLCKNSKCS